MSFDDDSLILPPPDLEGEGEGEDGHEFAAFSFLVFEMDDHPEGHNEAFRDRQPHEFGIELLDIEGVVEVQQVSQVPLAPSWVRGMINHKGRIVTVVDPAEILGCRAQEQMPKQLVLMRRLRGLGMIGLQVGRIREILPVTTLEEVDMVGGPCTDWVGQVENRLVHVLSVQALLTEITRAFSSKVSTAVA